ncbi:MAG: PEP-CTERM sorting domain-containing protein [Sphingomonas sp.]|uniref:PEPxxWA-CTERM sorting domain-containing protein n=1 Tax=Sphingomonas sp. TaxID=28214 RepID=UPI001ACE3821|nr:PEPxxWA-CTERM sorting domain-containing protein [Sphingomonas sp.]MBN8814068.1 PEP-CTERM sorting domain-containing protein [Sphingomonas sp.]
MRYLMPIVVAAALAPAAASAQTALTTTSYIQNFDTLASSGSTGTALPAGWAINETGTNANASYGIGDGSSNSGNTYSFGTTGSTERALGSLGSGSLEATYGVLFTNQLGSAITAFDIAYIGEQWRLGNSTDDGLTFEYSTNATSLTTGTWVRVSALDFLPVLTSGTQGALNGNLTANQRSLAATIGGLSITSGANFGFRWTDLNSGGNDHGLAIDNFSLTSTTGVTGAVPEPATWGMIILGFGAMAGAVRRRGRVAQRVRFA